MCTPGYDGKLFLTFVFRFCLDRLGQGCVGGVRIRNVYNDVPGEFGLQDAQHVLHRPVKGQARGEIVQDHDENQWHVLHHFLLHGIHGGGGRCQPGLNQHGNRHEHRHWVDREAEDVCHCVGLRQITNPEKLPCSVRHLISNRNLLVKR